MMAMAVASGKFLMRKVTLLLAGRRWRTGAASFFVKTSQTNSPVVLAWQISDTKNPGYDTSSFSQKINND
jgi:hypothetical protein